MRLSLLLTLPALGALALAPCAVRAATFCANTSAELQAALTTAASNGEDDTIRIETGIYTETGTVAFVYSTSENFDLTVEGGWLTFLMNDCALRVRDPTQTVLDGQTARRVMVALGTGGSNGAITLDGFTLRNGSSVEAGGGLRVGGTAGYTGDVTLDHLFFSNNVSNSFGGGLSASADGGVFILRNSLFIGNQAASDHGAASLTVNAVSPVAYRALIANNTFVENSCGACATSGVRVGGSARFAIANNAFGFHTTGDLILSGNSDLFNNNVPNFSGSPVNASGNLALVSPGWVNPAVDDYRLQFGSPLRNAGTAGFVVGALDFAGSPRLNDSQYDIGAYENAEILLKDGFENVL